MSKLKILTKILTILTLLCWFYYGFQFFVKNDIYSGIAGIIALITYYKCLELENEVD